MGRGLLSPRRLLNRPPHLRPVRPVHRLPTALLECVQVARSVVHPGALGRRSGLFRWRRSSSNKMLWAAAFVMVVGVTAALLLGRRGQSAPPASPIVSHAVSFAKLAHDALIYSETHKPTDEDDAVSAAESTPALSTTAAQPKISTQPSTSAESGSPVQPTARRSGITVEKLRAPVRRQAATFASSEPPSMPMPQVRRTCSVAC